MLMLGAILKNEGKCKENIGHPPKNGTDRGVTLAENTCPLFAYSCLFLTRQDACDWIKMQLGYSDPTEPRHIQRNVDILRNKAHQSMSDGDVLSAHKSLFRRAVLLRHFSAARILTTSISSIAQVFANLDRNCEPKANTVMRASSTLKDTLENMLLGNIQADDRLQAMNSAFVCLRLSID